MIHPLQTVKDFPDVPLGAKKLGCRNCRSGDRALHPHLGLVYCASCPVTIRQRENRGFPPVGPHDESGGSSS